MSSNETFQQDMTVTPPPSRTASDATGSSAFGGPSTTESDTETTLTEYHVTSASSDSDDDKEVKKILESETFKWTEMNTLQHSVRWDSPNDEEMPPLISDSEEDQEEESEEDQEEEDQEEDQEDQETSDAESEGYDLPPVYLQQQQRQQQRQDGVPPLITFLGLVLFMLHLVHFATLLKDQQERARNPCFAFKY
jgi:hypothetical protein